MDNYLRTKVCVIGAGPAGLMASIHSAGSNVETVLLESNNTASRKLLLSGGGRCNFTLLATAEEMARAFGPKGKFLSYSLHKFPPVQVRRFFRKLGLESIVEQDGCVFPVSERAIDVRNVLSAETKRLGVRLIFSGKAESITKHRGDFVVNNSGKLILAKKVIIATGGLSYPDSGSTGDGYRLAHQLGHTIVQPRASLVPLVTLERWPGDLAGISLENVKISTAIDRKKIIVKGAMLFTHDGIGGPAVLELSRFVTDFLPGDKEPIRIFIDIVSNIGEADLEKLVLKRSSEHPKKTIANILAEHVPQRVSQVLCNQFNFAANLCAGQLSRDLRKRLLHLLKSLPLSITRTRPIAEAMVTRGGVSVAEIEPETMESKICPGLFFAGEVIDVDGPCGGYNLQMCWSTGALASLCASKGL